MKYNFFYEKHKTNIINILGSLLRTVIVLLVSGSLKVGLIFCAFEMTYKVILYFFEKKLVSNNTKKEIKQDLTKEPLQDIVKELKKPAPLETKIIKEGESQNKKTLNYSSSR